jgi:CRISPR-associated endonuclease Csy4
MEAYIELQLWPDPEADPEFAAASLMDALFAKLHRGLVRQGEGRIGISFPDVGPTGLGSRLRLHGQAADLEKLMTLNWLQGMRDHLICGPISAIPTNACYRLVRRVQAKSSPERERRRLMARRGISLEAALLAIPDHQAKMLALPYLELASQSSGQHFRLFIEHLPVQSTPKQGSFSAYGLSAQATVPWF